SASLTVKSYPGTSFILGIYDSEHNHPLGNENLRFTRISTSTREWIAGMLRLNVKTDHIVNLGISLLCFSLANRTQKLAMLHQGTGSSFGLDGVGRASRNDFILKGDIRRIEKEIEAETVRLDPDDGKSLFRWADKLRSMDALLGFKSISWIPIAWMLASSGTEETISYFLSLVREHSPYVIPIRIMSDRDFAQINACMRQFPTAMILLCWWHVLHAWQQHLAISRHPELWKLLKALVRIEGTADFDAAVGQIQTLAPPDFLVYLKEYWLPPKYVIMWSAVYRKGRTVYELSDTNMLIEAGRRQVNGFDGPSLYFQSRLKAIKRSQNISHNSIMTIDEAHGQYAVKSQSHSEMVYDIDMIAYTCTCLDFPAIRFCKHICAVQTHYPTVHQFI
ncbi:hypothetical protein HYPSUDRAFT_117863, partial [Hypholoma sublateritium FD-334 SS-4]